MNYANKKKLTEIILNNLPSNSPWHNIDIDKLLFEWWFTGRNSNNLRLTDKGKEAFELAEIEYFDFDLKLEKQEHTKFLLFVGKKLTSPYFFGLKNRFYKSVYIRVFDSKLAMLITLYGSFDEYLKTNKL